MALTMFSGSEKDEVLRDGPLDGGGEIMRELWGRIFRENNGHQVAEGHLGTL
jgi:hypothetical protein